MCLQSNRPYRDPCSLRCKLRAHRSFPALDRTDGARGRKDVMRVLYLRSQRRCVFCPKQVLCPSSLTSRTDDDGSGQHYQAIGGFLDASPVFLGLLAVSCWARHTFGLCGSITLYYTGIVANTRSGRLPIGKLLKTENPEASGLHRCGT